MKNLKQLFLLDPDVTFLNHGSFGATPKPIFEIYQRWQRELERQPVEFLGRHLMDLLAEARAALGEYLNAPADDLAFVQNVTVGVNIVARSLHLSPGDEILTSDHEYGACSNAWDFICQQTGAVYIQHPIPLPTPPAAELIEHFWAAVTPRTRVIFISHITSATAQIFPIVEICRRARAAGIFTVIDGAHTPGHIPLDLAAIDPDFYIGNCHKWLMAPKGAGFLYTRKALHSLIKPLVVSWGWSEGHDFTAGSQYLDYLQWSGTFDPATYLSVPAAIQFQKDYDWDNVRRDCAHLLQETLSEIAALTGLPSLYPEDTPDLQMAVAALPPRDDVKQFQSWLYATHKIEIPCPHWNDRDLIRISIQGYNTPTDMQALTAAMRQYFF